MAAYFDPPDRRSVTWSYPPHLQAPEKVELLPWPDPTPEMLQDPRFEAIWQTIKRWDINVPGAYGGYCGATGNHVRAILDALDGAVAGKP